MKFQLKNKFSLYSIYIVFFFASCTGYRKLSNRNISFLYHSAQQLHAEYTVHHISADSSDLFLKLPLKDVLFRKTDNNSFSSDLKISLSIYSAFEVATVIDSTSFEFSLAQVADSDAFIVKQFRFRLPMHAASVMKVLLQDLNRKTEIENYITLDKGKQSSQQFLVKQAGTDYPAFKNYFYTNDNINIVSNNSTQPLFVRIFKKKYPLAKPPFASDSYARFSYYADSVYTLPPASFHRIILNQPGIYHFQYDSLDKSGLTLFCFGDDFPLVTEPEQLIEALRYITSNQEYHDLISKPNQKDAIDEFWVQASGSRDRARDLIKKYYNHIQDANRFFTSYMDGWKTDRGMIYIVFGLPDYVYRSSEGEYWSYNRKNPLPGINFLFKKVENPFTENDYVLERNPAFEPDWFLMVDLWRQGRVWFGE
jgi:GWxTD domain-containing protein